jgi:uncharacterized membrane protein
LQARVRSRRSFKIGTASCSDSWSDSKCQFSRRIQDGATLRGARYLPYADAHT